MNSVFSTPSPAALLAGNQVYDGLELDMFGIGCADSILVTKWSGSSCVRVLIDGGNVSGGGEVLAILKARGITVLDHIVCTHPHDDHAAGLVEILGSDTLTIGTFWMHHPWNHIDYAKLEMTLTKGQQLTAAKIIRASLTRQQEILKVVGRRKITYREPFAELSIGPLFVCGPTVQFYESQLMKFADLDQLTTYDSEVAAYRQKILMSSLWASTFAGGVPSKPEDDGELGGAPTEPENDSSVILFGTHLNDRYLFTADAGVPALQDVVRRYNNLQNLHWMQVPHHGSRRNITSDLIKHFKPLFAYISADGSEKHPRKLVVKTFKDAGTKLYGTYHPNKSSHLHFHSGAVPPRSGYGPATEL